MVEQFRFFHPQKTIEGLSCVRRLEELFDSDFIVISSPDWTHGEYLRKLQSYHGYIFCEKIPVMTREDLTFLKKTNNPFLYFDFNYRKSLLYDLIKEHEDAILYINHQMGHGLALKQEYGANWRSNAHRAPLGVFQLSGIHFFDLLVFLFGKPESYYVTTRNASPIGDSIDNFTITLEFQNRITANLFFSYTIPYKFDIEIITKEYLIEYDGQELLLKGPREIYNSSGLFIHPPVVSRKKIDIYTESLHNSVNYFLSVVKSKGRFAESQLDNNLLSNELFLDILDGFK
jgi:predicted dehydrogenase